MHYTSKEVYEFISEKNNDPIVEWKTCRVSGTQFPIYQSDLKFYDKISPTINGVKYQIPTPTLCPEERQRRRLSFRNERKFYRRKCDASGETIISVYSPDKKHVVYDQKIWWSDSWNALDYGKEFDFSRTCFEQFEELMLCVPRPAILNRNSENSEYTNISAFNKSSYMIIESSNNEDALYSYWLQNSRTSTDLSYSTNCTNCFDVIDGLDSTSVFYSQNVVACTDSYFLKNCDSCSFCIACVGLQNTKYAVLNKEVSFEEYKEIFKKLKNDIEFKNKLLADFQKLCLYYPNKYMNTLQASHAYGDFIINSQSVSFGYSVNGIKDSRYVYNLFLNTNDCYDVDTVGLNCSLIYESINTAIDGYNNKFCIRCWSATDSYYSNECDYVKNCFGCIGLRNKQYCIFNKQYTKEEYEALLPKLIEHMQITGEWGEFFPSELSPYGYNETVAMEHFSLTQTEAIAKNYKWQSNNYDPQIPEGVEVISKSNLPQDIQSVTDDILKKLFICEVTGRPFRIIKQELEFYKKHNLPLPTKHPDQRHLERFAKRNPRKLWKRECDCSNCASNNKSNNPVKFLTTYSPERKEKVYCETCYNKEVYG